MRFRSPLFALIASLVILLGSGGLAADFLFREAMAYYDNVEPARMKQMHSFQNYADICSVVFIIAAVASVIFGVLAYRRRRRAHTRDLHESHVA